MHALFNFTSKQFFLVVMKGTLSKVVRVMISLIIVLANWYLSYIVMKYIKHLKARYKIDIFPSYFSKHPSRFQHKANQYIKLAVVKNEKGNKNQKELT